MTKYLVLAVWLGMSIYVTASVARRVVDLPVMDDFAFVDQITGDVPVSLAWLWEAHNEHRMPLPKLVIVLVTKAFGIDFRMVPFLSVAMLCAATLMCVLGLARYRGRFSLEDTLVPILVCTWAQCETLIWTTTFQLAAATAFGLLWWATALAGRRIWLAGLWAAGAAMCGGNGMALVVGIVPWFVWIGARARGVARTVAWACAGVLTAYAAVYFASYERVQGHPPPAGPMTSLRFAARLVASAWTNIAALRDPLGFALLAFLVYVGWRLVRSRSTASLASAALMLGTLGVIGAVTIGRAGAGLNAFSPRYITLVTPMVVAMVGLLLDPAVQHVRRDALLILGALAVLSFPAADRLGHWTAKLSQGRLIDARTALLAGRPDAEVVVHYNLFPSAEYAVPRLEMLRRARGSVFRDLPGRAIAEPR